MPLSQESSSSSSSDLSAHSPDAPVYSPVSNFSLSDYSSNLEEGSEQLHDDQEQNRVLSPYLFQKQETTSVTNSLVTMWIKMLDHLENVQK